MWRGPAATTTPQARGTATPQPQKSELCSSQENIPAKGTNILVRSYLRPLLFEISLYIFIAKTIMLHKQVTALVTTIDHITPGRCSNPCTTKAKAPIAIIRKVGSAMPSVLRVRMVSTACGR